ncbi:MAG: hypothetical protein ACXW4S_09045 [Candidatus Deferrimicrobiaceae bacterium]
MKKFVMLFVVFFSFIAFSGIASANTGSYTKPTTYTDSSAIPGSDTITVTVREGTTTVCSSTTTSCTFTAPLCGTGVHTYTAVATSSAYSTTSAASNSATWTAPNCPPTTKTPSQPSVLTITAP